MMENCIYRFLNKYDEIIYVGKAKNLKSRLNSHNHLPKECYEETNIIEYCTFETECEMDLAERYYIPKIKPKFNTMLSDNEINFSILEFDNKEWSIYKKTKKKVVKKKKTLNKSVINFEKRLKEIELEKEKRYKESLNRKIIIPYTEEVFENMFIASEKLCLTVEEIYNITENLMYYGYEHPKYYKCPLRFMYYEDFLKNREEDASYLKYDIQKYTRGIICLTTNEFFINSIEINDKYNVNYCKVINCCKGLSNYVGEVDDKPMVYKWIDEYENMSQSKIDEFLCQAKKVKRKRKTK